MSNVTLGPLPIEVVSKITSYFNIQERCRLKSVCKQFKSAIEAIPQEEKNVELAKKLIAVYPKPLIAALGGIGNFFALPQMPEALSEKYWTKIATNHPFARGPESKPCLLFKAIIQGSRGDEDKKVLTLHLIAPETSSSTKWEVSGPKPSAFVQINDEDFAFLSTLYKTAKQDPTSLQEQLPANYTSLENGFFEKPSPMRRLNFDI